MNYHFSKLDYYNYLFVRLPKCQIYRLQTIQNNATKLIYRKKFQHITPLLIKIHWLNVENRIKFKAEVLACQCFDGTIPTYLSELINNHFHNRFDKSYILVPLMSSKTEERCNPYFSPKTWI